jgi:hypothetical protein
MAVRAAREVGAILIFMAGAGVKTKLKPRNPSRWVRAPGALFGARGPHARSSGGGAGPTTSTPAGRFAGDEAAAP